MKDYTKKNWNMENDDFRQRRRLKRLIIAGLVVLAVIIILVLILIHSRNKHSVQTAKPTPQSQYTTINLSIPAEGNAS